MANKIKLPCGLSKDGKLIYIEEAENGLACECVCPGCKQALVAKNGGKKREHHFAHLNVVECEHGYQSALHYMGKECFLEMKYLTFIKDGKIVQYKIDSVELERKVSDIIPDIIVTCDSKRFIVEIYVTHAVDDEKKAKIKVLQVSAIEIDLSRFHKEMIDRETLKQELCNTANFCWVYDADDDLIEQKRKIIQQFGVKIQIQSIGNAVGCPYLWNQKDKFTRFVTLDFCLHCPHCVYKNGQNFISCGKILPVPLNLETRRKLYANIFINDNKVMFVSEFKEYDANFLKNLERAMQTQYRIFQNIAMNNFMYATAPYSQQRTVRNTHKTRHTYYRRRRY